LAVVSSLDPLRGGTQSGATNLLLAGQAAGLQQQVVAGGTSAARERARTFTGRLEAAGVAVRQFPTLPWPPEAPDRWGLSLPLVTWLLRGVREFDIVHIHGVWGLGLVSAVAAARAHGKPIVVTPHESLTAFDIDDSNSKTRRRQKLMLKRLYLASSALFIVSSELEARDSFRPGEAAPAQVVHYPAFDPNDGLPELRPRGGHGEFRVGFLGRIHPKKNLDLLIDSIAMLPNHVVLNVAGDGPRDLVEALRRRAEARRLGPRVRWLGFLSAQQRRKFFAELDLLAMPSVFESFGMSAAEAMLHGVPVLVSQSTGIAEIVRCGGGGVVVPATVQATSGEIRRLDGRRDSLTEIGVSGQALVRDTLNSNRIGLQLRCAYESALTRFRAQAMSS
jgi:glycosyltransferase involved in cell wall biosynthesis